MLDVFKVVRRYLPDQILERTLHKTVNRGIQKQRGFLCKRLAPQIFFDAARQVVVNQIVNFVINPLA